MKFATAVKMARKGYKIRRMCWGSDMKMWWNGNVFLHSHPYVDGEVPFTLEGNSYPYVIEKDDLEARDWHVIA